VADFNGVGPSREKIWGIGFPIFHANSAVARFSAIPMKKKN
jgi:hypothetical protein